MSGPNNPFIRIEATELQHMPAAASKQAGFCGIFERFFTPQQNPALKANPDQLT